MSFFFLVSEHKELCDKQDIRYNWNKTHGDNQMVSIFAWNSHVLLKVESRPQYMQKKTYMIQKVSRQQKRKKKNLNESCVEICHNSGHWKIFMFCFGFFLQIVCDKFCVSKIHLITDHTFVSDYMWTGWKTLLLNHRNRFYYIRLFFQQSL